MVLQLTNANGAKPSLLASSPAHSQMLSHSCGEKSGEGLGTLLHHEPEMANSVSTLCGLGLY